MPDRALPSSERNGHFTSLGRSMMLWGGVLKLERRNVSDLALSVCAYESRAAGRGKHEAVRGVRLAQFPSAVAGENSILLFDAEEHRIWL